jgi:hypothetical protein
LAYSKGSAAMDNFVYKNNNIKTKL